MNVVIFVAIIINVLPVVASSLLPISVVPCNLRTEHIILIYEVRLFLSFCPFLGISRLVFFAFCCCCFFLGGASVFFSYYYSVIVIFSSTESVFVPPDPEIQVTITYFLLLIYFRPVSPKFVTVPPSTGIDLAITMLIV